jgi:hypothetical protein
MKAVLLAFSCLALSMPAFADTRNSEKDKTTMERNTSPATKGKQEEEHTEAHSQPDTPNAGGTTPRNTTKAKPKAKGKKGESSKNDSSSSGSSRPALDADGQAAFKKLDLDGDGMVSKAEAAGHADVMTAFDKADRNHDGKLSEAEYARAMASAKRQASR